MLALKSSTQTEGLIFRKPEKQTYQPQIYWLPGSLFITTDFCKRTELGVRASFLTAVSAPCASHYQQS